MHYAIVADSYPPLRSSAAVQLRDLSLEFVRQGHRITMVIASPELSKLCDIELWEGVQVVRLKTPRCKDVGYIRRTIGEFLTPFVMNRLLNCSSLANQKWDGLIWYSPTIFLGPLVKKMKSKSRCRTYLIIRDIFPEWAVDVGLMGRGLPYFFFKSVARYQYSIANTIGIQTLGNRKYFASWQERSKGQVDLLQNWLGEASDTGCSFSLSETHLSGRKIFVYAGNMGIAQGMSILIDLAEVLHQYRDIGFLFVGRGSDAQRLEEDAKARGLDNVIFSNEIHPDEIPGLYSQCHVGLVALDKRHNSHNIPGKFLTYMQSGLPVLASINAGNDLSNLIRTEKVGMVCEEASVATLQSLAIDLINGVIGDEEISDRCRELYKTLFSPKKAVEQIVAALEGTGSNSSEY